MLFVRFRVSEYTEQCQAMRGGLATVVPLALLSLMSWKQMERRVCGETDVDVEFLKVGSGCTAKSLLSLFIEGTFQ